MCADALSRRTFLTGTSRAAAAGWLTIQLPLIAALAACAREDSRRGAAFTFLTPTEGTAMRAFAAQIVPSDGGVGAEEVGAVHFVDRALGTPFFAEMAPRIRAGLAELEFRAGAFEAQGGFASLTSPQQVAIMKRIEGERFFGDARTLVLMGTFADPSYGGNEHHAGWAMIGMEHRPMYTAPFGWYDAHTAGSTPAAT